MTDLAKLCKTSLMGAVILFQSAAGAAEHDLLGQGKEAYDQLCAHCHGIELVNPGTSSFDLRQFPKDQMQRFYASVLAGKGSMPAWAGVITQEELEAVWMYVATRAGHETSK